MRETGNQELGSLSFEEELALSSACYGASLKGPAELRRCHARELGELEAQAPVPASDTGEPMN
jgi:hypothetical protein